MYENNGEQYFVFDSHLHFWDASPANWVKGQEEYAKGWIECFHAYQGLGPAETHWPIEKFQKYSLEDFERDVFVEGGVDAAVFQSTYLKEWYTTGFNDSEQNGALIERFPDKKLIINGRFDMVCPIRSAYRLHKIWRGSKLVIVPDAGHSATEPGIRQALVQAVDAHREMFAL